MRHIQRRRDNKKNKLSVFRGGGPEAERKIVQKNGVFLANGRHDNHILEVQILRSEKKQPKHKVFERDIPGTSGTQTSGYPGQKLYASALFLLF